MRKILIGLIMLLAVILTGCGTQQKTANQENTRTNRTSAVVEKSFNRGAIRKYVKSTTYDKPRNTIEFHLTSRMSKEMKGKRPDRYTTTAVSFADRNDFHQLVRKKMGQLRRTARNQSVRAQLIYQK